MFKRSALSFGRGPFNHTAGELTNPKQIIIAKSLATEILDHNMIQTTTAKAKFINSHFHKYVDKVLKYKSAEGDEELQLKYKNEAKNLLSGRVDELNKRDELFAKSLELADKWKSRIGDKHIRTVKFLKLSHLEPAKHDAHPVTFIELMDLPLFVKDTDKPTYGNLSLWLALECLLGDSEFKNYSKSDNMRILRDFLKNLSPEEKQHFFEVDLKKVKKLLQKKKFFDEHGRLVAPKKEEDDDDLKEETDENEIKLEADHISKKDEALFSSIRKQYNAYNKRQNIKEKSVSPLEGLGEINMNSRAHGVKVMKE